MAHDRPVQLHKPAGVAASLRRIGAMVRRFWYLIRSSPPRLAEIVYWPLVFALMWGFLQLHLQETSNYYLRAGGILIASVLLWDMLLRSQQNFSMSFLEEIWSRNLGHLMMSPLRPDELLAAMMTLSIIKLVIGLVPVSLVAYLWFDFDILSLGVALPVYFLSLVITGFAFALATTGAVLRYGLGVEGLVWSAMFILLPLCCIYYPVAVLPAWLQPVALSLPPTWVFEGLRALMLDKVFRWDYALVASALNLFWFAAGYITFRVLLQGARRNGTLLQMGE